MSLTDKLTPEQEAKIPEYRERFLKMGLSTEPADRPTAEAAIKDYYKHLKMNEPRIIWELSPMAGARLAAQALKYSKGRTDFVESELRAIPITVEEARDQAYKASYGSFEAYYVSFYAFIENEVKGTKKDPVTAIAERLCASTGAYWIFDGLAIMTERPTAIVYDGERLHNETGPAIAYPDGEGVFCLNSEVKSSLMQITLEAKLGK